MKTKFEIMRANRGKLERFNNRNHPQAKMFREWQERGDMSRNLALAQGVRDAMKVKE